MLSPAERYLVIPEYYAKVFGGLRWSDDGLMIETAAGNPFAWRREVQLFLEGFMSVRPPLHFVHMLHLMELLGVGPISATAEGAIEFRRCFLSAAKPIRNAGTVCAFLCREFAGSSIVVTINELRVQLSRDKLPSSIPDYEYPPLGPSAFLQKVSDALKPYSREELSHWFKYGCAPNNEPAERVAEELEKRPPNLTELLVEAAANRERLAGALALAPSLSGALTLPPRRLDHSEIPVGGYADVTTRGEPERLLPSQYALDGLEFVRRFAEKELLYFRREEPFNPTREELVILLDQGVRTWGGVRFALAGAVFAFAGLARRRKLAVRIAVTADDGKSVDPVELEASALGDMLEASDLSLHPAAALEVVLKEDSELVRDVVILTHPRSLLQKNVADVTCLRRDTDRLFAVTVDSTGEGQLCELQQGQPLPLTRFRVDLEQALNPPMPKSVFGAARDTWTGDVEPIPFPFWFGPMGDIQLVAIDHESQWLLVACANGMLHAEKLDGSAREVLPRGVWQSQVLKGVAEVLGVRGGFVVCGSIPNPARSTSFQFQSGWNQPSRPDPGAEMIPIAVHYDFRTRRVTSRIMLPTCTPPGRWVYFSDLHSIAYFDGAGTKALDLETGGFHPGEGADLSLTSRARMAIERGGTSPNRAMPASSFPGQTSWREFDRRTGRLGLRNIPPWSESIIPISDGEPILRDASIVDVQYAGDILAVHTVLDRRRERRILLIRGPRPQIMREIFPHEHYPPMHLSADGRYIAVKTNHHEVSVFATDSGGEALAIMEAGGCHSNVEITTGEQWLLVSFGKCQHFFRWDGKAITHGYARADANEFLSRALGGVAVKRKSISTRPNSITACDPARYKSYPGYATGAAMSVNAVVDHFGHVAVLSEAGDRLVAVIAARRNKAAIWLPDGTRWGDAELAGAVTPGAAERVARALKEAETTK